MAAYTQFGYGGYPSASQLLSSGNVAQSPQTGDTPTAQATISAANAPALSPGAVVGIGAGDVSTGALSPDGLSQNSSSAVGANVSNAAAGEAAAMGHTSASGSSCCENGRPIMTDPVSGQTVCSCQYDSARLALSSYSRLPAASVGVYGTPYPSTDQNPYQSIGVDSSAFYSPLSNPYALKDATTGSEMTAWTSAGLQPTTGYYSYDPMSAYGYGASYDLAARRKNATRESTATLKAWLNEHKKNPYPTKGEKIMLAIITKMTLTQVSTWFANARRRLKKENKMTWEPKNRTDDDDDALVSDEEKEKDELESEKTAAQTAKMHVGNHSLGGTMGMGMGSNMANDHRKDHDKDEDDFTDEEQKPLSHPSDMRTGLSFPGSGYHAGAMGNSPHGYHPYHQHPAYYQHQQAVLAASYHSNNNKPESSDPKNQLSRDCGVPIPATKPKIWSLADTVACKTPPPAAAAYLGQHQQQPPPPPPPQQQNMPGQQAAMSNSMMMQQQHMQQMQQQQQQPQAPAQHMMSNYGATPYSRAPTTAYGGFLGATAQQLHTTSNNIPPYNNNNSSSSSNNSNTSISHNRHSSGTNTPIIPTTTNPLGPQQQQQQPQQPQLTPLRAMQQHPHAAAQRASMGFPEAQPDTPPQTPPNMKVQSVAANLLLTASQVPTIATCRSSSAATSYGPSCYGMNYGTRFGEYSPRDDNSSASSSCSSGSSPQLQNEANFKPLFKSQPISVASFVPPV